MVISQPAAIELAETCARIERPLVSLVAWLRRSRQPSSPALATGTLVASPDSVIAEDAWMDGSDRERNGLLTDPAALAPVRGHI